MILNESDPSISDGDDSTFVDELNAIPFEESVGSTGLISNNSLHECVIAFLALSGLCRNNLDIHVESAPAVHEVGNFAKLRLS